MFGFGKKKKEEQLQAVQPRKPKTRIDKLVMGAIIGVAVGSVVGMTLAPKKGKDTRKFIAEKSKVALDKGVEIGKKLLEEHGPHPKKKKSFLRRLLEILFKRSPKNGEPLKKIPREHLERD